MLITVETPWGVCSYSVPSDHVEEANRIIEHYRETYWEGPLLQRLFKRGAYDAEKDRAIREEIESLGRNKVKSTPAGGNNNQEGTLVSLKSIIDQLNEYLGLPTTKSVAIFKDDNSSDIKRWLIVDKGEDGKITLPATGVYSETLAGLIDSINNNKSTIYGN